MKNAVQFSKLIIGVLFILSGFVKADDPLGFSYKLTEYFEAFGPGWNWAINLSLPIACIIPVIEMTLGFLMLIGAWKVFTLWAVFGMTLFFTFLTWYTAHYNKVTECGCFGDAIPMTAWQSFYKNIALLALLAVIFIGHKHYLKAISHNLLANSIIFLFFACSTWFSWYCYNYLPVIDFRPYKVGTDIPRAMKGGIPDVLKFHYILKNKTSGEVKEFDKLPDNYQNQWNYDTCRTEVIKKGVAAKIFDFNIVNLDGIDCTDSMLSNPNYSLLIISSSLNLANQTPETEDKLNALAGACIKRHIQVICLTASGEDDIRGFIKKNNARYPFYNTDDTQLRTMIRSNPGIVMLKAGIVIANWHYHRIPDFKSLNEQYFHTE